MDDVLGMHIGGLTDGRYKKKNSLWLHVPSDMKNGIIRNEYIYNNNGLRTRVILDFVDQNVGWGTLHDILHEQQVLRTDT